GAEGFLPDFGVQRRLHGHQKPCGRVDFCRILLMPLNSWKTMGHNTAKEWRDADMEFDAARFRNVDRSKLKNISDIVIDTSIPCEQRIESYVRQMGGNPYCYMDQGIMVCIGYADTDVSLQERLKAYACSLR
ncbi:MAG: DUF6870 family protein, partial [Candidatus Ventricola sp.]